MCIVDQLYHRAITDVGIGFLKVSPALTLDMSQREMTISLSKKVAQMRSWVIALALPHGHNRARAGLSTLRRSNPWPHWRCHEGC